MPKLSRYPRGYMAIVDGSGLGTAPLGASDIVEAPSDPDIETLYRFYIQRTVDTTSWKFRNQVIRACVKHLGNFHQWLALQAVANDYVHGLNFEFLKDTVLFIREGRRDMSTFTWNDLLLEHPEPQAGVASPRRMDGFEISNPKEFDNLIGKWCSHSNGFEDMLCTAHVLYGVSKKPMGAPHVKL